MSAKTPNCMGITAGRLKARDPSTLTEFGRLVETFAVNELLKQSGWADTALAFSHFRTSEGQEVDLVCESDDGRVVGIESEGRWRRR
jgi:predicted AAA+ superfamily ATPase